MVSLNSGELDDGLCGVDRPRGLHVAPHHYGFPCRELLCLEAVAEQRLRNASGIMWPAYPADREVRREFSVLAGETF